MWDQVKDIPEFKRYVPDTWSCEGHRKPEKRYLFAIITTMYAEWLRAAIIDCTQQRHAEKESTMYLPKQVELTQFWAQELMNIPYISRKLIRLRKFNFIFLNWILILMFFGEEFGGRNPGTIKAMPKGPPVRKVGMDGHVIPKPIIHYTIAVSLKEWLADAKAKGLHQPLGQPLFVDQNQSLRLEENMQPDFEISRVANPQSFVQAAQGDNSTQAMHLQAPQQNILAPLQQQPYVNPFQPKPSTLVKVEADNFPAQKA